eukprot:gene4139-5179_t
MTVPPNFMAFGCEVLNYLKSRYTKVLVKQDFNVFVNKIKAPKDLTVYDGQRAAKTLIFATGIFFVGEVVGKNSIAGYNPGYDIDVNATLNARD